MLETLNKPLIHEIFRPPTKPVPMVIVRMLNEADLSLSFEKV